MRVLEVIYSFKVGGSEIVGIELAEEMVAAGIEVLCGSISGEAGPLRERCSAAGITPVEIGELSGGLLARNGISLGLVRRLAALKLDAIHLHHMLSLNKLGLAARMAGIPRIVLTEHSLAALQGSRMARLRARVSCRFAHHFTAVHAGIRDYLIDTIGVPAERVDVIANGIKLSRWHRADREQLRRQLGLGNEVVFVFVGRLEPVKNVPDLIRAFLLARQAAVRPCRLLIVGDGSQRQACEAVLAGQQGADSVQFCGEVADPRTVTGAADAFVMNSISEGSPRAMIEAMAVGLPCICPAVGGVVALIENRGWLTPPLDVPALAAAMTQVAGDAEAALKAGERGREFVRSTFDSGATVRRYVEIFNPA